MRTLTPRKLIEIFCSLALATGILYWMYRDFPFSQVSDTLCHGIHWDWMLFSLLFGILPQILRGLRWRQALEPLHDYPSRRNCISAVYMSFAASLIISRIGEISRCATLKKIEGTSFPISLGTVVTERIIDSALVLLILFVTFVCELPAFLRFFGTIGFTADSFFEKFSVGGITISLICLTLIIGGLIYIFYRLKTFNKFQDVFKKFTQGLASVRQVHNIPLYIFYSISIWVCYFLHFFLAFYAFDFTSHLGIHAGLLAFCMITVAVLVPTPNGAGPWHFAVKVVLMQFSISVADAILFALIVHALQTLLVIVLGIYGYLTLTLSGHRSQAGTHIENHKTI